MQYKNCIFLVTEYQLLHTFACQYINTLVPEILIYKLMSNPIPYRKKFEIPKVFAENLTLPKSQRLFWRFLNYNKTTTQTSAFKSHQLAQFLAL